MISPLNLLTKALFNPTGIANSILRSSSVLEKLSFVSQLLL